jgi:hypothetical protein
MGRPADGPRSPSSLESTRGLRPVGLVPGKTEDVIHRRRGGCRRRLSTLLALVFASFAVVDGIALIAGGLGSGRDRRRRWFYVIMLVRPDVDALALAAVLGTYALLAGLALLWAAWQVRKPRVIAGR